LLRDQSVDIVCAGQSLFSIGEYDNQMVYLLSGAVSLQDMRGLTTILTGDNPLCCYPLANHQPRRQQATAVSDCSVIRFDADQFDAMLAWDQVSSYIMLDISAQRDLDEDADWMLTLLKSNLFYKVPPMNIRQILNKFTACYVSSGDTIIRQGELGDCCYFIKEGFADVYQAADERSPSQLVAQLAVGRCFGEDALVNEAARNATIRMHSNGVLMKLMKQDFFLLLKSPTIEQLNLTQAKARIAESAQWIDVRSQDEFEQGHCEGAINMPLDLLKLKSRMLNRDKAYVMYCNSGRRSKAATFLLGEEGFTVSALTGGFSSCPIEEQKLFEQISAVL
jgi:rhodanese-related sulfurtransferase